VTRYVIGTVNEFPDGARRVVSLGGREIGVFNVGGRYYALRNRCPHQGGPLCRGQQVGSLSSERPGEYIFKPDNIRLRCPWHQWEFDLETGQSWFDPDIIRTRAYKTKVASGTELLASDQPDDLLPRPVRAEGTVGQPDSSNSAGGAEAPRDAGRRPGPYVAETFPVSVEDEYIVVDTGR
jgi:nitrite reductase/ring-hydroxylating ferredoxin subunit